MDSFDFMSRNGRRRFITSQDPVMDEEENDDREVDMYKAVNRRSEKNMESATNRPRRLLKGAK